MSWQSYVDEQLVDTHHVAKAAVVGADDGGTWASSKDFLKGGEGAGFINLFKSPADVFAKGVVVNGVKYMGIKGDSRSIYAKKGATGVVLVKTETTILVAYYNETQQPGNAASTVEKLADYLIENKL
ncbi:Profilin-P [Cladobotryum mycophilum]|uniref:Profilin n=1 Tax=Cladobotryum mycophilum TaxID=491253 RepID=A0ABR0S8D9_9HYPO